MGKHEDKLATALAIILVVGAFVVFYLIGKYSPTLGSDLADLFATISVTVFIFFVLYILFMSPRD